MNTLDFFNSQFEKSLLEGTVDDQTPVDDGPPIPSNINKFNTAENWGVIRRIWLDIYRAVDSNVPYVTIEWPNNGRTATLTRNQAWTVYQRAAKMSKPKRDSWGLTTLNHPNNLLYWLSNTKFNRK